MKVLEKITLTLLASALLLASPTYAAPVIFSGSDSGASSTSPRPNSDAAAAAFDAAVGTTGVINFESAPVGSFSSLVVAPGVTLTGVDVFSSNQEIRNSPYSPPESKFGYNTTPGGNNFASILGGTLTFTFATPIDSFGAYFSGIQNPLGGNIVTLTFNDGSSQVIPFANVGSIGGLQFLGFTDTGALISSVTIDASGDVIGVDDVRGQMSVPEGSTAFLFSLGMFGLFVLQWNTGRRSAKLK